MEEVQTISRRMDHFGVGFAVQLFRVVDACHSKRRSEPSGRGYVASRRPTPLTFGVNKMKVVTSICRWLSSALIALAVSCVAFPCISVAYEMFDLQKRLGVDNDVCWLALLIGPALIVVIHRGFRRRAWVPVVTLLGGLALAALGVFRFLSAREAGAHHVPTGPFSGLEHDFAMLLGLLMLLVATLSVLGAILALVARRTEKSAEPGAAGYVASPRS